MMISELNRASAQIAPTKQLYAFSCLVLIVYGGSFKHAAQRKTKQLRTAKNGLSI